MEAGGYRLSFERSGTRTSEVQGVSERYVFPFEKLEVWQDSLALADEVLELIDRVP